MPGPSSRAFKIGTHHWKNADRKGLDPQREKERETEGASKVGWTGGCHFSGKAKP
jgi:hypothetical protein